MSMTWEAAVKFRATPPALRDMRNTVTPGSAVKALIMRSRASMLMLPSSRTQRMPTCVIRCPTLSARRINQCWGPSLQRPAAKVPAWACGKRHEGHGRDNEGLQSTTHPAVYHHWRVYWQQGPCLLQAIVDQIEHGGKLREDERLGGGIARQHQRKLLTQCLDLGATLEVRQLHTVQDGRLLRVRHLQWRLCVWWDHKHHFSDACNWHMCF